MAKNGNKLIILRGNSGSGKSAVAKALRDQSKSGAKIAIVEQDYLRRFVLTEKEADKGDYIGLIEQTVEYALSRGYNVILEGILSGPRHGDLLHKLMRLADRTWVYYFEVSFDESLRRHNTKHNAHEFGEKEMREWYKADDKLGVDGEITIPETNSFDGTVTQILSDTKL